MRPLTAFALLACFSLSGCLGSGFSDERRAEQARASQSTRNGAPSGISGSGYYESLSGRGQWNGSTFTDANGTNYDRTQTHPSYPAAIPPPQR